MGEGTVTSTNSRRPEYRFHPSSNSRTLTDCREELLNQMMEAERLLEHICIQEGRKEDPKSSPDLHAKCVEKARKKQEESDARIQKNLELIRKVFCA